MSDVLLFLFMIATFACVMQILLMQSFKGVNKKINERAQKKRTDSVWKDVGTL